MIDTLIAAQEHTAAGAGAIGASACRESNCKRQATGQQLGSNWAATGGQLGSGTRFQMHFACVIKMSLIYGWPGPTWGSGWGWGWSWGWCPGKELAVFPHFGYHLPQTTHIFPSCGRRVNYNYDHEDRPTMRLQQLQPSSSPESSAYGSGCCQRKSKRNMLTAFDFPVIRRECQDGQPLKAAATHSVQHPLKLWWKQFYVYLYILCIITTRIILILILGIIIKDIGDQLILGIITHSIQFNIYTYLFVLFILAIYFCEYIIFYTFFIYSLTYC